MILGSTILHRTNLRESSLKIPLASAARVDLRRVVVGRHGEFCLSDHVSLHYIPRTRAVRAKGHAGERAHGELEDFGDGHCGED